MKKMKLHKRIILSLLKFSAVKKTVVFISRLNPRLNKFLFERYDQFKQHAPPQMIPSLYQNDDVKAYDTLISGSAPPIPVIQILTDISSLAASDGNTGIHRVTRSVLKELFLTCPPGYIIQPIYRHDDVFYYAREFTLQFLDLEKITVQDEPVTYHKNDIFLGLDLDFALPKKLYSCLSSMRSADVKVYYIIHDVLPITNPEFFNWPASRFENWLTCVSRWSNGLLFVSNTSLNEYAQARSQLKFETDPDLKYATFSLGTELIHSKRGQTSGAHLKVLQEITSEQITFLMVGALVPRKGHRFVLNAFELLWAQGTPAQLLFIGKKGLNPEIYRDFKNHPEFNKKFFWLDNADDQDVAYAYQHASSLIMASNGEGFGLPIIEALQHNLPVIARDLNVFREVGGDNLSYFSTHDPAEFAQYIQNWLLTPENLVKKPPTGITLHTWKNSAQQILDCIRQ